MSVFSGVYILPISLNYNGFKAKSLNVVVLAITVLQKSLRTIGVDLVCTGFEL